MTTKVDVEPGMEALEFDFARDQKQVLPKADTYGSLIKDGTFIVTGSNTGLGFEAARALVANGASKVILAVRSQSKGEAAVARIEKETGIKGVAEVWILDMSSDQSILDFGKKVQTQLDRLDGISENAAVAVDSTFEQVDGKEISIAVNVLGTMLLAGLVAPKLHETAKKLGRPTHLSIVGSGVAFYPDAESELNEAVASGKDIIDFFNGADRPLKARYPLSKLLLIHVVRAYSAEHPPSKTNVVVNYVNPGLCETELDRNASAETKAIIAKMRAQLGRTAEEGSRTLVHGLFGGEITHGAYTSECVQKEHYVPDFIAGPEGKQKEKLVWESVKKHIDQVAPGVL